MINALWDSVWLSLCLNVCQSLVWQNSSLTTQVLMTVWDLRQMAGVEWPSLTIWSSHTLMTVLHYRIHLSLCEEVTFSFVSHFINSWHLRLSIIVFMVSHDNWTLRLILSSSTKNIPIVHWFTFLRDFTIGELLKDFFIWALILRLMPCFSLQVIKIFSCIILMSSLSPPCRLCWYAEAILTDPFDVLDLFFPINLPISHIIYWAPGL